MHLKVICVILIGSYFSYTDAVDYDTIQLKLKAAQFPQFYNPKTYLYPKDKNGNYDYKGKISHQQEIKTKEAGGHSSHEFKPSLNDGYNKEWKSLRSEKFETETIDNPHSDNPAERYVVKSSLKVREKNPFDDTTTGYDHEYEYPPSLDHDYYKSAQLVDYYNSKTDPFGLEEKLENSKENAPFFQHESIKQNDQNKKINNENVPFFQLENIKQNDQNKNIENVPFFQHENIKDNDQNKKINNENVPFFQYENIKQNDQNKKNKENTPFFQHENIKQNDQNKQKKKGKTTIYQLPSLDVDYHRNVHLVDYYLAKYKNNPETFTPEKVKDYTKNELESDYTFPSDTYKSSDNDNLGPSNEQTYQNYKSDDPSFDYNFHESS